MKTIRLLVSRAGLADARYQLPDFSFQPGEVAAVHPQLADAWIASGQAEAVEAAPEPEVKAPSTRKGKR